MYLTQGLHRALQQHPDKVATVCGGRRRTFAQLAARVASLAGALVALGLREGDRVACLAFNSDRYVEFYLAAWWAGLVPNPVNVRWSATEIAWSLDDCETGVLVVDDAFASLVPELQGRSGALRTTLHAGDGPPPPGLESLEALMARAEPRGDLRRGGDTLAGILYTGGTTGRPKGVMLTHANIWSAAVARMADCPVPRDSVQIHAAPLFHASALGGVARQLVLGGTHVLVPSFKPDTWLDAVERERVTDAVLVPSMMQMLLDHPRFSPERVASLRRLTYGASPIAPSLLERVIAAFPHAELVNTYGMTEASPVIAMNPPENHRAEGVASGRVRSVGRACLCVEIRIAGPDGAELPRGSVGEILIRGPNVTAGYWRRPEETAAALREGWLHTGDAGWMDDAGWLYLVDRLKDMIVTGGENVYSAEVEAELLRHPGVAAAAVIGIPSERWGEAVHAVVVARAGVELRAAELVAFCRGRLAGYKCPKSIEFRAELPMSSAGKPLKNVLREPYWQGHERRIA